MTSQISCQDSETKTEYLSACMLCLSRRPGVAHDRGIPDYIRVVLCLPPVVENSAPNQSNHYFKHHGNDI